MWGVFSSYARTTRGSRHIQDLFSCHCSKASDLSHQEPTQLPLAQDTVNIDRESKTLLIEMDGLFLNAKGVGFKALWGGFSFFLQLFSEMYLCRQLICSTKGLFGKLVGWVFTMALVKTRNRWWVKLSDGRMAFC